MLNRYPVCSRKLNGYGVLLANDCENITRNRFLTEEGTSDPAFSGMAMLTTLLLALENTFSTADASLAAMLTKMTKAIGRVSE